MTLRIAYDRPMRTVWILGAWVLAMTAAPSCAGKAESTDPPGSGGTAGSSTGGASQGGASGEGGWAGGSGSGGASGAAGWGGQSGMGGGYGGASGGSGPGGSGPGGSSGSGAGGTGPCGGYDACPGNIPAIVCSTDNAVMLTCKIGDACPAPTVCSQYCPTCTCHVAPPMSGNLMAGCDTCTSDTDCAPNLACKEDPALQGSGAKTCVMK